VGAQENYASTGGARIILVMEYFAQHAIREVYTGLPAK